ncbi:MAG: hypothetical protein ACYDBB_21940 [Armatimonadota bacterium]
MPNAIERIVGGGLLASDIGSDGADAKRALAKQVEGLKRAGVTHVRINTALVSIPWVMDPENSYLRFTTLGPPPDQYVTSTYNVGLYHDSLLAENRKLLLRNAELAREHGFRCAIMCVEPTFMPESFFRRYPDLRGPRVDNPACSTTPLYALCPMVPQVQDHYQQLIRKMLELVPEIDEMQIFTNDSGAGVCYSTHLYSGPNGPYHCKDILPGKQAQVFAKTLIDAAREINPEFRVVMTSGLSPKEKAQFAVGIPDGAASSVYGAFAWGAGLEDRWGTQAIGPKVYNNPEERAKVRTWQFADYEARVRQIKDNGGIVYANYSPYYYMGDDPRPFETHEIVCKLLEWGVTNLLGGASGAKYSTHTAVIRHAIANGIQPTETVVREITEAMIGPELAPSLLEVFRLNEHVAREMPVPPNGHFLSFQPLMVHMPIVPDEEQLGEHDLDYFMTPVLRDEEKMKSQQGGVWRVLNYGTANKVAYLQQLETVVYPAMDKAMGLLSEMLARPALTTEQRECLEYQQRTMAGFPVYFRHLGNWLMASLYRMKGDTVPPGMPSLPEIIQAEIALYEEADRAAGKDPSANPRLRLMRAHQHDAIRQVDLTEFPLTDHLGTAGWEGAHEIKD